MSQGSASSLKRARAVTPTSPGSPADNTHPSKSPRRVHRESNSSLPFNNSNGERSHSRADSDILLFPLAELREKEGEGNKTATKTDAFPPFVQSASANNMQSYGLPTPAMSSTIPQLDNLFKDDVYQPIKNTATPPTSRWSASPESSPQKLTKATAEEQARSTQFYPSPAHTAFSPDQPSSAFLTQMEPVPQSNQPIHASGSGSSYRGSIDGLAMPQFDVASNLAGLGLDPLNFANLDSNFQQPNQWNQPATAAPQSSAFSRRRGIDLGIGLEDLEIMQTLGTGTFGRVMLCRLTRTPFQNAPSYFAMKVLGKAEIVRLRQVSHVNSERTILASVQHNGIVNLFCTFQDERNVYLLLEFIQGGELFSHLRRAGRFSPDVSRFYAANILLALEYLHSRDIIYRDLKPENLLIDHQGYIKLTDLGFAKHCNGRTFTLCGTPEYLAPEIIQSFGHGKAADCWSLGVLLYEMLCGFPCFYADSPLGIYEKIIAGKILFPDFIDPYARDLIRRLLSADLTKRLGNLAGGIRDIMNHPFFEGVDWDMVRRREIGAPIIPRSRGPADSSHFERYPTFGLENLPALYRAHDKRIRMAAGTWREPTDIEKEMDRRSREASDVYGQYFRDF